jgi:hypothetical protein
MRHWHFFGVAFCEPKNTTVAPHASANSWNMPQARRKPQPSVACGIDSDEARALAARLNSKWAAEQKRNAHARQKPQHPTYQAISALSRNIAGRLKAEFYSGRIPMSEPIRRPPLRRSFWQRLISIY